MKIGAFLFVCSGIWLGFIEDIRAQCAELLAAYEGLSNLMPTLTRLIIILAVIAACIYGAMLALVTLVSPVTSEITVRIPAHKMVQQSSDNAPVSPAPAKTPYTDGEPEAEDAE